MKSYAFVQENTVQKPSSPLNKIDVVVVGGGAAGFFAALSCADTFPQARVTILEKSIQVLSKVRISGGGRCNVTHSCFVPKTLTQNYPRGSQALLGPFHSFQPKQTVEWFESHGVPLKTEADGRIFPVSDKSQSIIDALIQACDKSGVTIRTGVSVESIAQSSPSKFLLTLKSGETVSCDKLLLATGSNAKGYEWAAQLGHTIEAPVPSLFTFGIPDKRLEGLSGISVENAIVNIIGTNLKQSGPLLITHWGLSGPAILKLSAWGARILYDKQYSAQIHVNWLGISPEEIEKKLIEFKAANNRKTVFGHSPFNLAHRLWEMLCYASALEFEIRWADISSRQIKILVQNLSASSFLIRTKSSFKDEFVTCGGINLDDVNFKTMESKKCAGLYFAGEILDVDGVTGGFNFQNAWTTGWLAGKAMGK